MSFMNDNETLFPNWQKESWQTFEKASGHVRQERVNKWPNSMTDIWWWWMTIVRLFLLTSPLAPKLLP